MALARISSPVDGDPILASLYNGDLNNIHDNALQLISPLTGDLDAGSNNITNLALENLSTSPTAATAGRIYYNTALQLVEVDTGSTTRGVGASASRVSGLTGTLSSQTGSFAADQYVMVSTDKRRSWVINATSGISASVGTAGPAAGGRDVAAVFASTYCHWYAITTGAGSTAPAVVVSSSPPPGGPVMPSNYYGWTYLGGSVYTSASTTVFAAHRFRGAQAQYVTGQIILAATLTSSETSVATSTMVPTNALRYTLGAPLAQVETTGAADRFVAFKLRTDSSDGDTHLNRFIAPGFGTAHTYAWSYNGLEFPNVSPIYALSTVSSTDLNNTVLNLVVQSYIMPNGDV